MKEKFKRGDVLLVNLDPTVGSEQKGTRPVVVIQNDVGNEYSPLIIIAAITSKVKKIFDIHVHVFPPEGGLAKESIVLLNQIRTIDKSRVIKKKGTFSKEIVRKINNALKISLDLDNEI